MRFVSAIALVATVLAASLFAASGASAQTPPAGESYTSPTYGYAIPLGDEWTVESTESENGTDVLRITNGEIVAFVTGFPSTGTPEACIEDMADIIGQRPQHDNLEFETPIQSSDGSAFGVVAYTFITAAGEQLDGRNRITCFALDDGTMVRLELLLLADDVAAQQPVIDALERQVAAAILALRPEEAASPEAASPEAASPEPASPEAAEASPTATATTEPRPTETATTEPSPTETATTEPSPTTEPTSTATVEPSPTTEPTDTATVEPPSPTATTEPPTVTPISDEPTVTTQPTIESTPTEEAAEPVIPQPGNGVDPSGLSYTSPQYGYSLSWDETFTVAETTSNEFGDYLGLESTTADIFVDLIGEPWTETQQNCLEWLAGYYRSRSEYSNVVPAVDPASANPGIWETTGLITMTYTSPDDGSTIDLAHTVACSPLPDQGVLVTLELVTSLEQISQHTATMDALRAAFVPPAGATAGTEAATVTPTTGAETATATSTAGVEAATATPQQSPVAAGSDADYTSPNFGYTLSWDDSWSVIEEQSDSNGDYVRITNGPVNADLLSESWDPASTGSCFDLIVAFYSGNSDYAGVRGVADPESQTPGSWDVTGVMALTYLATTSGEPLELINYVACSVDEQQGIVVSLEQFVDPAAAPEQIEAMNALREGFSGVQ